jgi:amidophosphoribosyltransferase
MILRPGQAFLGCGVTSDRPADYCGVFAIYGHPQAAPLTYMGLYALQHRGQESAGIVSSNGRLVHKHLGMGLVADVFADRRILESLEGHIAIGHNRYSTTGSTLAANIQPIVVKSKDGPLAVAHNGNLTNTRELHRQLEQEGSIFATSSDSEILIHLIARSRKPRLVDRILEALNRVRGAYSLVFMTQEEVVAVRDPHGFRPLIMGTLGDAVVFASESCALDLIGATVQRDVKPGELIHVDSGGVDTVQFDPNPRLHQCIFEFVYFSRPDSRIFGDFVDKTRRKIGRNLAEERPAEGDIVISVPDSSNTAALGFANRSEIPFEIGLIRNHYIGRTFIHPYQPMRDLNVRIKFNPVGGVLNKRRVVVVEDSIVRGTTLKKLTRMIRQAGAKEVHVRVSCPPIRYPCFYGMDFPTRGELIAAWHSEEKIREYLDADSLAYLSVEKLVDSMPEENRGYCTACFTGEYPIPITENNGKYSLEDQPDDRDNRDEPPISVLT